MQFDAYLVLMRGNNGSWVSFKMLAIALKRKGLLISRCNTKQLFWIEGGRLNRHFHIHSVVYEPLLDNNIIEVAAKFKSVQHVYRCLQTLLPNCMFKVL